VQAAGILIHSADHVENILGPVIVKSAGRSADWPTRRTAQPRMNIRGTSDALHPLTHASHERAAGVRIDARFRSDMIAADAPAKKHASRPQPDRSSTLCVVERRTHFQRRHSQSSPDALAAPASLAA
jgi:hypothetical protein